MFPEPKEVLALARQIEEAEASLSALRDTWKAIFTVASAAPKASRGPQKNSFTAKIETVLKSEPGRVFTIGQVADETGLEALKVGRALFRLAKTKRIDSPSRGLYRAARSLEVAA